MYDKTKGTLQLNKTASPRKHAVDKPTTYTRLTVLRSNPGLGFPFLGPPHTLHSLFITQVGKILPSSPSSRGIKRNQTKNSKVGFAIHLKCGRTKNSNVTDESNVIHRGFFMYVQWLDKNYCI